MTFLKDDLLLYSSSSVISVADHALTLAIYIIVIFLSLSPMGCVSSSHEKGCHDLGRIYDHALGRLCWYA